MSAPTINETGQLGVPAGERWTLPAGSDRKFKIALAVALAVHLSFLTGIGRSRPTSLGKEDGAQDAISVSLVTEQDLKSRSTVDVPDSAPPSPPVAPPPQPKQEEAQKPEPPPPDPVKEPPQKLDQMKPAIAETEEAEPAPAPTKDPEPAEPATAETAAAEKELPDLFSLDKPSTTGRDSGDKKEVKEPKEAKEAKEPHEAKSAKTAASKPQKKQQKRTAALDLSTPSLSSPGYGGSASFSRPPGITKSGLNDAFARAVIRALQQTMPQLRDVLGRVTVRILLNENGNVTDVQLLAANGNSRLGQEVVFAARQTSYPIPPTGSNTADRTFMVTYIYD